MDGEVEIAFCERTWVQPFHPLPGDHSIFTTAILQALLAPILVTVSGGSSGPVGDKVVFNLNSTSLLFLGVLYILSVSFSFFSLS